MSVGSGGRVAAFLSSPPSDFSATRTGRIPNFRMEWADLQREFERDEICVDVFVNVPSPNSIDLTAIHSFVGLLCVVNLRDHDGLDVRIIAFLSAVLVVIEFILLLCFC
jgi:hypothetical protein